jgi:hypothetical protein
VAAISFQGRRPRREKDAGKDDAKLIALRAHPHATAAEARTPI